MVVYDKMVYAVNALRESGSRPSTGLKAIQECGGVTIAQHPEESKFPEMSFNALKRRLCTA
jgi:hypothetical protein